MRKLLLVLAALAATLGLAAGPAAARERDRHDRHERSGWDRGDRDSRKADDPGDGQARTVADRRSTDGDDQATNGDPGGSAKGHGDDKDASASTTARAASTPATTDPTAPTANGSLAIVHAIPSVTVDGYVDGQVVASGLTFGGVQTLDLAPGRVRVEIRTAGAPATDAPLLVQDVGIKPDVAKSLHAHLDADGKAEADFVYDNTTQNQQKAQLTVRHLAAAPAVDVYVDDQLTFDGLENGGQAKAFLDAGTYTVRVTAAGDPATVVVPDTPLTLDARTNTIVTAGGDLAAGTLGTIVLVRAMDVVATSM